MPATTSPGATSDTASLPKMPSSTGYWIGSLLIALSIIGGSVAIGIGFGHLVSLVSGEYIAVPSDSTRTLDAGRYKLYHSSSVYDYDTYDTNPKFTVVGPDGNTVPVTEVAGVEHSSYSTREQKLATFTAPTKGGYQIKTELRPERPGHAYGSLTPVPTTRPRVISPPATTDEYTYPSSVRLAADDSEV